MMRRMLLVGFFVAILLPPCRAQLTFVKAEAIIRTHYRDENGDCTGCMRTYIDSLTIDSIREKGNTAQVYYRMAGTTNNGSAYENRFDLTPGKASLRRNLSGRWKYLAGL